MAFSATDIVLLVTFILIYGTFLVYDLFKRGDNYGSFAYIAAILPANYLWYMVSKDGTTSFGPAGAMLVLAVFWLLAIIRDIYIKDTAEGIKDADDMVLLLLIGIILNLILAAVLPALSGNEFMQEGTRAFWKYFFIPDFNMTTEFAPSATIVLIYKLIVTLLVIMVVIPLIIDLKETPTNITALLIITLVFMIPFGYLAFLWAGANSGMIWVLLFLFSVMFFIFLLMLTQGQKK